MAHLQLNAQHDYPFGRSAHSFIREQAARVPEAPFPPEIETIEGLLECLQCGSKELAQLTLEQYKTLARQPFLKRECAECAALTDWGYSYVDGEVLVEPLPTTGPAPSTGSMEKRNVRRLTIKLPVRIRLDNGREVTAETENLSKTGVCFVSAAKMNVGEIIRLVFGTTALASKTKILARVVRRQERAGTNQVIYGVRLEKDA